MSAPFSLEALSGFLRARGLSDGEPLVASALSGGQSNPTFRVSAGTRHYVLRKKPPGQLLQSAHAIDREYRVMRALQGSEVPVPPVHVYCDDASIVGTPFFLMDFVEGRVFVDQSLPGMSPAERGAVYRDMNRVIAALHRVDHRAVGLETFGKPDNYLARQIARWSGQCRESSVPLSDAMHRLMDWLPRNLPPDAETALIHGDFRLDNLVLHPSEPRVIGVLDWELSTLGSPLADFAYQCMAWRIPPTLWRGIGGLNLAALGIPDEGEYMRHYANSTGRDPAEHWDFYLAYNLFRIAAILYGIAGRAGNGTAVAADAVETGMRAGPLAELGWRCASGRSRS